MKGRGMAIIGDFGLARIMAFFGIFALMLVLQTIWPRRRNAASISPAWSRRAANNLGLALLNSLLLRLLASAAIPFAAVAASLYAQENGWGLFNNIALAPALEIIAALILLDLAIYGQHVAAHLIPFLWRFHQVHHADEDFDVTTALRFHPGEIIISMLWKIILVFILGPSPLTVVLFEIILNGCAMFNHSNLHIPAPLDRVIRLFLVTPDMHRIHHSTIRREQDSNYGFNIPLWDRLFGTYIDQPAGKHGEMKIGLENQRHGRESNILWNLFLPFGRPPQH
jgi:sterol desaturase/sphingolipid hydroxylase (fatty acid hydroxylase superfamily)